jgi:hypothetical protein
MGRLADDDHKQLVSICRDWRYGRKTLEEASREVVTRCRYEITDGLKEALDLLVFGTPEYGKRIVLLLAYLSAERAVTTASVPVATTAKCTVNPRAVPTCAKEFRRSEARPCAPSRTTDAPVAVEATGAQPMPRPEKTTSTTTNARALSPETPELTSSRRLSSGAPRPSWP